MRLGGRVWRWDVVCKRPSLTGGPQWPFDGNDEAAGQSKCDALAMSSNGDATTKELEAVADSLSRPHSVVESWLVAAQGQKKLPASTKLHVDYERAAARPARLGLGAKPESSSGSALAHESVFGNYQLKMQLTGKMAAEPRTGKKRPLLSLVPTSSATGKRPQPVQKLRPAGGSDDDDSESRAKTVGKRSVVLSSGYAQGKKNDKRAKKNSLL